jgi:protein-tyrosine phosphatase/membrane-associated phospholipid phosphatase
VSVSDAITDADGASTARPWRRALAWLAFLAPFFYLTYGLANWLASLRTNVPSIVFPWEHAIPFIGWTIIPYWSINAFYGLSLFLCRTKDELDTHGLRLLSAQVIAVMCFILFPLRFTFAQSATEGFSGFLFAALTSFDQPFNQAPSLHIALLVILWVLYARYVPRRLEWPLHLWSALVGVSVLTTYQHHFIDIPTGMLLGFLCLWLWPDSGVRPVTALALTRDRRRLVLAGRYSAGSLAIILVAHHFSGAAWLLFWPAISFALVAANYAFFGAAGFQKAADGRMSFAARALLAPYLVGAWCNSRAWTRKDPQPVEIAPGVSLGRMPDRAVAAEFATVVDLSAELPRTQSAVNWRAFPLLDLVPPEPRMLRAAAAAIEQARAEGPVLVCCALGFSRSAAAVATWLVTYGDAISVPAVIDRIRILRPRIVLGEHALAAITQAGAPPA